MKAIVQGCRVCTLSRRGSKIPRSLGQQIDATSVSELLHFDLLYIGESRTRHKYMRPQARILRRRLSETVQ